MRGPILRTGTPHTWALVAVLCVALLATSAVAGSVSIPPPSGSVVDLAGVLDEGAERRLAELIRTVRERTTAEIAVLTVPTTEPLGVQEYSIAVFDRWKIGRRGQDNGLLFLVAIQDRRFHITTGYGLEELLPDGRVGEIRDRFILPAFRRGAFAEGILRGTEAIAQILLGQPLASPPRPASARPSPWQARPTTGILLAIFIGLILATVALSAAQGPVRRSALGRSGVDPGDLLAILVGLLLGGRSGRGGGGGWSGGGGFSSGGFGGFGGGSSGGGGAGGSW